MSRAHCMCTRVCVCVPAHMWMHLCVHSYHITPAALMGTSVQREGQARTQVARMKPWLQTPQTLSQNAGTLRHREGGLALQVRM